MVVGAVAAGKSSLLAAIAGEIKKISGKVEIAGKCVKYETLKYEKR